MILRVIIVDFSGSADGTVELSAPVPIFGNILPIAGADVQNNVGEIDIEKLPAKFVLTYRTASNFRFRSAILSSADTIVESGGNRAISFALFERRVVVNRGEVASLVPDLPLTTDGARIETMTIGPQQGFLRISGTAINRPPVRGSRPRYRRQTLIPSEFSTLAGLPFRVAEDFLNGDVDFTSDVELHPARSVPVRPRLIRADVTSSNVSSASTLPIIGFLADIVVDLILLFVQNDVRRDIEEQIQTQLDEAVDEILSGGGIPESATVTLEEIEVTAAGGIAITAVAGLPLRDICPGILTAGSVRIRDRAEQDEVRRILAKTLKGTTFGDPYLRIFESHRSEVAMILALDPVAGRAFDKFVYAVRKEFGDNGNGVLSSETAALAHSVLGLVAANASTSLSTICGSIADDIELMIGKQLRQFLSTRPPSGVAENTEATASAKQAPPEEWE